MKGKDSSAIFITQVLGAPVFIVGIIEGIAEGSASLFKTVFGYLSDKIQRRKPFVVVGYGASAFIFAVIEINPMRVMVAYLTPIKSGLTSISKNAITQICLYRIIKSLCGFFAGRSKQK